MLNRKMKPIAAAVGALAVSLAPAAAAETVDVASADPFETQVLEGVLLATSHGEGGCGEDAEKPKAEGEGKCGEGEGKCGEDKSDGDGEDGDAEDSEEDEESAEE